MEYDTIIAGGTFDRFHLGHESFLEKAFSSGKGVVIGLTTKYMLKKTVRPEAIWPYEKRKEVLEEFISKYGKPFEIHPINDIFGFSTDVEGSYAIMASEETRPTCETINKVRRERGLKELDIIMVSFVLSEDCRRISSSRIRKEEIDRNGKLLIDYSITERLREELKKPMGKIFEGDNLFATKNLLSYIEKEKIDSVVCVGDQVSHDLINSKYRPKNIIIDGKVMRDPIDFAQTLLDLYPNNLTLNNPPGTIAKEVWKTLKEALDRKSAVFVKGEDDLLVFPTALLAKNKTAVVYGQPGRGKVLVEVDDDKKEELRRTLSEFETISR